MANITNKVNVVETIECFPFEGALAFFKACKELHGSYGSAEVEQESAFGSRIVRPVSFRVDCGDGNKEEVLFGPVEIPGLKEPIWTGANLYQGKLHFTLSAEMRSCDRPILVALVERTKALLKQKSIYRGRAFKLASEKDGTLKLTGSPEFIDPSTVSNDDLFFRDEIRTQIESTLFSPISNTQKCREMGIPLKRGVLLAGPYGTGKTLTALLTAQKCVQNNWTFILLDRAKALKEGLAVAHMYTPCVLFVEDLDREMKGDKRTVKIDDVLNTLDGIESKSKELICVFTTNHVETINKAMLRPGRIDSLIITHEPDAKTAVKLVHRYGKGFVEKNVTAVGEALKGFTPAVIREVVERTKLSKLYKNDHTLISEKDLLDSIDTMQDHLRILKTSTEVNKSDASKTLVDLGKAIMMASEDEDYY